MELTAPDCSATRKNVNDGALTLVLINHDQSASAARFIDSHSLSSREVQVLEWVTTGKTNRDVVLILDISPRMVPKHLERIFVKLGVETRTAAVGRVLVAGRMG